MFKLGRAGGSGGGAGRGGAKRPLPPTAAQSHRPGASRPPIGGGGGRSGPRGAAAAAAAAAATSSREESYTLTSESKLDFASIIRLTPDLVEEIRMAEARGAAVRIKFDASEKTQSGNVIDVDGKEFQFTSGKELGELIDSYEERRNGDDGHGLLVERGPVWRKLDVLRILDESAQNHVKMRSVEAERQLKSRKAIVLDPANPSVKNQAKTMAAAAVEGSMRRNWKAKDQLFKKRKVESNSSQGIGIKSVAKAVVPHNSTVKVVPSISPLSSPPEQLGSFIPPYPVEIENISKSELMPEQVFASTSLNKDGVTNLDKRPYDKVCEANAPEEMGLNGSIVDGSTDLRKLLISILSDNPKGMSIKAIEKAVGGTFPNAGKRIEHIIKNIAVFLTPGRYILKRGVKPDSSTRSEDETGSSPENPHDNFAALNSIPMEGRVEEEIKRKSEDPSLESNAEGKFPEPLNTGRKSANGSEEKACSSSESGSDSSDSDSSDSGSDSGSQSQSKSNSDSDSDNSSSGKEGSDEDVDIISSDDKDEAEQKAEAAVAKLPVMPWVEGVASNGKTAQNHSIGVMPLNLNLNVSDAGNAIAHESVTTKASGSSKLSPMDNRIQESPKIIRNSRSENFQPNMSPADVAGKSLAKKKSSSGRGRELPVGNPSTGANEHGMKPIFNSGKSGSEQPERSESALMTKSKKASGPEPFQQKESSKRLKPSPIMEPIPSGRSYEQLAAPDTSSRRSSEQAGLKYVGQASQMSKYHGENPMASRGKGSVLRREPSDLELGEFREPSAGEEAKEIKSPCERKRKSSDSNDTALDHSNPDTIRARNKAFCASDARAQVSPGILGSNGKIAEAELVKPTLSQERVTASQSHPYLNSHNDSDSISRFDRRVGTTSKNGRKADDRMLDNLEDSRKEHLNMVSLNDENHGGPVVCKTAKELMDQNMNGARYSTDQTNNTLCLEHKSNDHKRRESSSDEDEPELKGPIKDYLQYKEYVQEYRDKYNRYCSLNKNLENFRNEFLNMGHELERAKGDSERYHNIIEQLKATYHQHGANHKQTKRTFVLLHKELKNIKQRIKDFAESYAKE